MVLTPVLGAAATASCPCSRSLLTSFDPMSPVPPITTTFIFRLVHSRPMSPTLGVRRRPADVICSVWPGLLPDHGNLLQRRSAYMNPNAAASGGRSGALLESLIKARMQIGAVLPQNDLRADAATLRDCAQGV